MVRVAPCRCCLISAGLIQPYCAWAGKLDLEKLFGYIALTCLCVCSLVAALGEYETLVVFSSLALAFAVFQILTHFGIMRFLPHACCQCAGHA